MSNIAKKLPDLKQGPHFDELFDAFMLNSVMLLEIMVLNNTIKNMKKVKKILVEIRGEGNKPPANKQIY